jgi:hypothetical protein
MSCSGKILGRGGRQARKLAEACVINGMLNSDRLSSILSAIPRFG